MKKILSLILALSLILTFAACKKETIETNLDDEKIDTIVDSSVTSDAIDDDEEEEKKEDINADDEVKPSEQKPVEEEKPTQTPSSTVKPEEEKPSVSEPSPEPEKPSASTLGNTLLSLFNSQASSGANALSIAEALITSPSIAFAGGAMPVEEGLLSGFDNNEIKGFKEGAMFAPMIGSIPFVGYVFELENAADASSFISNLRKSANLRWNICVEAEEMITGSKGNKVFFVMCPKSLEE